PRRRRTSRRGGRFDTAWQARGEGLPGPAAVRRGLPAEPGRAAATSMLPISLLTRGCRMPGKATAAAVRLPPTKAHAPAPLAGSHLPTTLKISNPCEDSAQYRCFLGRPQWLLGGVHAGTPDLLPLEDPLEISREVSSHQSVACLGTMGLSEHPCSAPLGRWRWNSTLWNRRWP